MINDIVVIWYIITITEHFCFVDSNMNKKHQEKMQKYEALVIKLKRLYIGWTIKFCPLIHGALDAMR